MAIKWMQIILIHLLLALILTKPIPTETHMKIEVNKIAW